MRKPYYEAYVDANNNDAQTVRVPGKVLTIGEPIERTDKPGMFYHLCRTEMYTESGEVVSGTCLLGGRYQELSQFKEGEEVDVLVTDKGGVIQSKGTRLSVSMFATNLELVEEE